VNVLLSSLLSLSLSLSSGSPLCILSRLSYMDFQCILQIRRFSFFIESVGMNLITTEFCCDDVIVFVLWREKERDLVARDV
jgi:hypothetical protein